MWPFDNSTDSIDDSDDSDGSCDHHHFGEWEEVGEYKMVNRRYGVFENIETNEKALEYDRRDAGLVLDCNCDDLRTREWVDVIVVKEKSVTKCQHTLCREADSKWEKVAVFAEDERRDVIDSQGTDIEYEL